MQVQVLSIPEVKCIIPNVFGDTRGYFFESFQAREFAQHGLPTHFVQDNISHSKAGTLRGLHYQIQHIQAKLVFVLQGEILDIVVDIRPDSPTFGQNISKILSAENQHQLFIPAGFAHGFCVLSESTTMVYKCSDYYHPESERGLLWNDPALGIHWPEKEFTLSDRDQQFPTLATVADTDLPTAQAVNAAHARCIEAL